MSKIYEVFRLPRKYDVRGNMMSEYTECSSGVMRFDSELSDGPCSLNFL